MIYKEKGVNTSKGTKVPNPTNLPPLEMLAKTPVYEVEEYLYTEDFKNDYISLTDIAKYKSDEPFIVINNWLRNKDNIQFLGLWESMYNPNFNPIEFERFKWLFYKRVIFAKLSSVYCELLFFF